MSKFDVTLKEMPPEDYHEREFWRWSAKNYTIIRTALTQAAEIERGDKVVVPREPTVEMFKAGRGNLPARKEFDSPKWVVNIYKSMITASEGNSDE